MFWTVIDIIVIIKGHFVDLKKKFKVRILRIVKYINAVKIKTQIYLIFSVTE